MEQNQTDGFSLPPEDAETVQPSQSLGGLMSAAIQGTSVESFPVAAEPTQQAGDTEEVALPQSIQILADGKWRIELFSEKCVGCSAMTDSNDAPPPCHSSSGNTFCPAGTLVVVKVGREALAVNKLKEAIRNGKDADRNKIMQTVLTKFTPEEQRAVFEALA